MNFILDVTNQAIAAVLLSLVHNWPYLLISILIAAALKKFVDMEKVSAFLQRNNNAGIITATAAAVATPLCSCGTTAVTLGMMAGMMPWAPIIAFMVASPLTSPEELFYSAGIFGWTFALTFFIASIVLGLAGGVTGAILDQAGWLKGQSRMGVASSSVCTCDTGAIQLPMAISHAYTCESTNPAKQKVSLEDFFKEVFATGKQLMKMYLGFAFIGYFINGLIPTVWLSTLFGGNLYGVPLAATLGLPFYINTEASLPLIRALIDGGMSQGAALAFMISGAGTSVGAIAGALTIARWRVIAVVVGTLWVGAILFGYIFNAALSFGWV